MVGLHWLGRRARSAVIAVVAVVAVLTLGVATSSAAAPPASCMGHEASGISPPGTSEEVPGGMPALMAFFREAFPDAPPGKIVSGFAKLHAGSHEACDEAFGEGESDG